MILDRLLMAAGAIAGGLAVLPPVSALSAFLRHPCGKKRAQGDGSDGRPQEIKRTGPEAEPDQCRSS
jgi:hypothetical protein